MKSLQGYLLSPTKGEVVLGGRKQDSGIDNSNRTPINPRRDMVNKNDRKLPRPFVTRTLSSLQAPTWENEESYGKRSQCLRPGWGQSKGC